MKKRTQIMPPLLKEALFIFQYYHIEISKKIWLILCKSYSTIWPDCGIIKYKKELTLCEPYFAIPLNYEKLHLVTYCHFSFHYIMNKKYT
jgi:hypothetical protein